MIKVVPNKQKNQTIGLLEHKVQFGFLLFPTLASAVQ